MSESVVDAGDVEKSVTQVLTHFVQGGGEQAAMSVQLLQEQVEIDLGYDKGSLSKWHIFLGRTFRVFFKKVSTHSTYVGARTPTICKPASRGELHYSMMVLTFSSTQKMMPG